MAPGLHLIRFSSSFVRFFFSMKKYAVFRPHFYKSILALSTDCFLLMKILFENFVHERRERYFKIQQLYKFTQKNRKIFVLYVTVWLVRIRPYKSADEKTHIFLWRTKNAQKRTKNGYCVNLPLKPFSVDIWHSGNKNVEIV